MRKLVTLGFIVAATLATSTVANAQNIVADGGFESPVIAPNSYVQYNTGATIGSPTQPWTVTAGSVDLVESPYVVNTPNQALDLYGSTPGTITQLLNTVATQVYSLTFAYSHNNASPSNFLYTGTVSAGSLVNAPFSHTGATTPFSTFTAYFTALAATTPLTFASGPGAGNGGIFLDDVRVAAVPEPATWALMLLGFGIVGAALRRRRQTFAAFA